MHRRTDIKIKALTERVKGRREELMRLSSAGEAEQEPVELDQSRIGRLSRMDAMQGQAMAQEIARRRAVEFNRVEAALDRISTGEFGFCVSCGEEIESKRLDLDPTVPTCINCAQRRERQ